MLSRCFEQGVLVGRPGSPPPDCLVPLLLPGSFQAFPGLPLLSHAWFPFAVAVAAAPLVTAVYAYALYPLLVWAASHGRRRPESTTEDSQLPYVTVTVPVYNNVTTIRATLERLLKLDCRS